MYGKQEKGDCRSDTLHHHSTWCPPRHIGTTVMSLLLLPLRGEGWGEAKIRRAPALLFFYSPIHQLSKRPILKKAIIEQKIRKIF